MLIHDKLISDQFRLDFKNDRSSLLQAAAVVQHHQPQGLHLLQPPSPPMAAMDIYSAYAYQQQLQQHLFNSTMSTVVAAAPKSPAQVLDLSRRDSVDLPRKSPSPYQTSSSFCSVSPAVSPNDLLKTQQPSSAPLLSANLLYAAQAQQQAQSTGKIGIASNLDAALYSGFYYPSGSFKPEPTMSTTPPPVDIATNTCAVKANNNILHNFASAAAVAGVTNLQPNIPESSTTQQSKQTAITATAATTPTSSTSSLAAMDPKNTRPFKAFPRDPLVIAANFAATDILLDNPRVERYTEYRKRVLEQIRSANGGSRTISNPKMRRTNSTSGNVHEGSSSNTSENDERHHEESSDCESNSGMDNQSTTASTTNPESATSSTCANTTSTTTITSSGGIVKDAAYYERRRKNNAAAKKSRDRRRIKEDELAMRAAYLERQNIELLCQIEALKAELTALKAQLAALISKMS